MTTYDPELQRQAKALAKKAREAQVEQDEVVCTVLRTPAGRKWLYHKLQMCSTFATPWVPDAHATAFNCGQQNIGFQLLADIMSASPDLYVTMCQENSNASGNHPRTERPADDTSGLEPDAEGSDE